MKKAKLSKKFSDDKKNLSNHYLFQMQEVPRFKGVYNWHFCIRDVAGLQKIINHANMASAEQPNALIE